MPTSGELERERLRQKREIHISDMSKCYYCKSTGLKESDKFCPHCGFPQQGTQKEMRIFLIRIKQKKDLLNEQKKAINKARNILYFLAILNLVVGLILSMASAESRAAVIIVTVIISAIYAGLGIWCNYNPFPAILSAFFVFIVLTVINGIYDPSTLYKGLFMKIFIISGFIYGYKAVKESERLEKELVLLKTSVDLNDTDEVPELPA